MNEFVRVAGVGVAVFASTNIDDILLLSAFFAEGRLHTRSIVIGQFIGIAALFTAAAVAAYASVVIPSRDVALLGAIPLILGMVKLWQRQRVAPATAAVIADDSTTRTGAARSRSQMCAVAGVTIANGGDNLGVYIPLFAQDTSQMPLYAGIFALMTGLWCVAGYRLTQQPWIFGPLRRYGDVLLPIVLIALGAWILRGVFKQPLST